MNHIKKLMRFTREDYIFLTEAFFLSLFIRIVVSILPFRWYAPWLKKNSDNTGIPHPHIQYKVTQAIIRSRKLFPWQNKCLTEAITAKLMLHKRGIGSTLFLGVNKENSRMTAHAWLKCGETFITGKRGSGRFTVVSSFS